MDKTLFVGSLAALVFGFFLLYPKRSNAAVTEPKTETPSAAPEQLPRGLRNNNPMNLRYDSSIPWIGQTGFDKAGYATFDTAENGIRAGMIDIRTGFERDNENTVRKIISEWAPETENPTSAYIQFVARRLGVSADMALDFNAVIIRLAQSIVEFENGSNPYPDSLYQAAYNRVKRS